MDFQVRFRFNKLTGEVEVFDVDDLGSGLPQAEHDTQHDRVASEIGRLVDHAPRVSELLPGRVGDARDVVSEEAEPTRERGIDRTTE